MKAKGGMTDSSADAKSEQPTETSSTLCSLVSLFSLPSNLMPITCAGTSWASLPQTYGDAAGEKIEDTLGTIGKPVGQGLSHAVAPVGDVVGAVVKPVMILGDATNDAPEWGPGVESSARNTAGSLLDQGKEALKHGRETTEKARDGKTPNT